MLPSASHQGPPLCCLVPLLLPWLPVSLCWPQQDRTVIITVFTRFIGKSCLMSQILMVDMQQRTSLGTFIEVTQFETQYYFWPKQHSTSQSLAAKPLTKHIAGKESACNVGDLGLIPGLGRSPGEGNGYPLQYSDLENSMNCIVQSLHVCKESYTTEWLSLSLHPTCINRSDNSTSEKPDNLIKQLVEKLNWYLRK